MAGHLKLLPLFLLPLFTFSVYGDLIASIDCGASEVSTDSNTIVWTPDNNMFSNGVSRVFQTSYSVSSVMDTLRVFTTRKKNCYSTSVKQGDKVLVRASFHYGDYDRLSSPPSFDLHFDGNYWTTVQFTSLSEPVMHEAIYVTKRDVVSVCVAQTNTNQFPFISALEVRSLDSDAYNLVDQDRALFLRRRKAFGASGNIRYPSDRYDRIWIATEDLTGTVKVTNDANFVNTSTSDSPPSEILQNAITVKSLAYSLIFALVTPSTTPVYLNMYFTEVTSLDSTETRSFRVYESSYGSALSQEITPPYGGVDEFSISNYTFRSATDLYLRATTGSTLPPLISAIESFNISNVLTDGTDSNDVKALALLQNTFDVLGEWNGDPCLPAPYSWDWLNCSNEATPRITALYLDSFELSGSLPDISAMDALTIIDLHNNSLDGSIPSFLGALPNLQQLNLAYNHFSGAIPTSFSKNNKLKLNVTGNPSLCAYDSSCSTSPYNNAFTGYKEKSKKKSNIPLIIGITIPTFVLICVAVIVFIRRARPTNVNKPNVTGGEAHGQTDVEMVNNNSENDTNNTPGVTGGGAPGNTGVKMANNNPGKVINNVVHGSPSPLLKSSDGVSKIN